MIELIIGIATAVLFSCMFLWSYRRGIKDGLELKDNKTIEPINNPVQAFNNVMHARELSKEEKEQAQFMSNLLGYIGEAQKEVNR